MKKHLKTVLTSFSKTHKCTFMFLCFLPPASQSLTLCHFNKYVLIAVTSNIISFYVPFRIASLCVLFTIALFLLTHFIPYYLLHSYYLQVLPSGLPRNDITIATTSTMLHSYTFFCCCMYIINP